MSVPPTPEASRSGQDGCDRPIEEIERDFRVDPCNFLRRACQAADYGAAASVTGSSEASRAPE
jgi:hypothetical protein